MHYVEHPPAPALREVVRCLWSHEGVTGSVPFHVLPDGCLDLVWDGVALKVAGPDTRPFLTTLPEGYAITGLRFHPGVAPTALGVPASALRDSRVALEDLWGVEAVRLAEALGEAPSTDAKEALLASALARRVVSAPAPDRLVKALVGRFMRVVGEASAPPPSVELLADELGVSSRQLLRRCTDAVGYGPKVLLRVLRFQEFLRQARAQPALPLARLAVSCGYTDQAHLAHEAMALGGKTPGALRGVVDG
ncbi:AraC family transcriptional regulator [Chondromyces crocatus]|uniref:DNA-binding domain-containing protein n=1 Tax=Chondromyces crocatus TaxID=52 RepID=A0A0K1ED80_CHOCO|nr:helix-turn-helix domain-containing protein [Chondromyces crocatus]AKT38804.1 DNA-binding domain-containing protein [Chondromyces crocatus]